MTISRGGCFLSFLAPPGTFVRQMDIGLCCFSHGFSHVGLEQCIHSEGLEYVFQGRVLLMVSCVGYDVRSRRRCSVVGCVGWFSLYQAEK